MTAESDTPSGRLSSFARRVRKPFPSRRHVHAATPVCPKAQALMENTLSFDEYNGSGKRVPGVHPKGPERTKPAVWNWKEQIPAGACGDWRRAGVGPFFNSSTMDAQLPLIGWESPTHNNTTRWSIWPSAACRSRRTVGSVRHALETCISEVEAAQFYGPDRFKLSRTNAEPADRRAQFLQAGRRRRRNRPAPALQKDPRSRLCFCQTRVQDLVPTVAPISSPLFDVLANRQPWQAGTPWTTGCLPCQI